MGTAAIDAVVNIWTEEALASRPDHNDFHTGNMKVDRGTFEGVSLEDMIRRMDVRHRAFHASRRQSRPCRSALRLYRYIANPGPDVADVEQLFELPFTNVTMGEIRSDKVEVEFFDAEEEEVTALGAIEVTGGFTYQRGWTTDRTARLLHDYSGG